MIMGMNVAAAPGIRPVEGEYLRNTLVGQVRMVPAVLDVEYWQEADGSWGAHCPVLGVSATGENQVDLFGEMADQIDEFWQILNEGYDTLDDKLKDLFDLKGTPLNFVRR
jgi:hypothetical protein